PPEWIVDHDRAVQRRILQVRAVELDVLGDAIDNHAIPARLGHLHAAQFDELSCYAFHVHAVDFVHHGWRERVLHAEDDADCFQIRLNSYLDCDCRSDQSLYCVITFCMDSPSFDNGSWCVDNICCVVLAVTTPESVRT